MSTASPLFAGFTSTCRESSPGVTDPHGSVGIRTPRGLGSCLRIHRSFSRGLRSRVTLVSAVAAGSRVSDSLVVQAYDSPSLRDDRDLGAGAWRRPAQAGLGMGAGGMFPALEVGEGGSARSQNHGQYFFSHRLSDFSLILSFFPPGL